MTRGMTREEAMKYRTGILVGSIKELEAYEELINRIYDDSENNSCDGCIHHLSASGNFPLSCGECSRFYSDNFEEIKK